MANLYHVSLGAAAPEEIPVVVEIPKGSRNKYEYDAEAEAFRLDRVLSSPLHYVAEYGFAPQTLAGDGDPVDVLVPMEEPTFPGCIVMARPIGLMKMVDEKGEDYKILAVPTGDRRFGDITTLDGIPGHLLLEIEHFFTVYKALDGLQPSITGWENERFAKDYLIKCHENWKANGK